MQTQFFVLKGECLKHENKKTSDVDSTVVDQLRDLNDSNYNEVQTFQFRLRVTFVIINAVIDRLPTQCLWRPYM